MSDLLAIQKHLDRIESKVEKKYGNDWMSTKKVCEYTGLSVSTIQRGINSGNLKVHQGTGKNMFRRADVDRWIQGGKR